MREREIARRYLFELFGSLLVYIVILTAALHFGRPMLPGPWRTLVLTSPMIGFGLMGWVLVRQYRRVDEFIRRLLLENTAIAAGVTACVTFTYGFLENAGYPRLSMFVVWPVLGGAWGLVAMLRNASAR
ncbi:MAG: hypothetical protein KAY12_01270 [Arenimonas sp.]|nr:hypothetical protein [Arenimonas sp.]MBP8098459.1 hypothetical protein [Arenimonas sp.]